VRHPATTRAIQPTSNKEIMITPMQLDHYVNRFLASVKSIERAIDRYVAAQEKQAESMAIIAAKLPEIEDVEDLLEDSDPADEIEPSGKN
jgi:hypothetical protein